jgi:TrpR-related protein YerC/YecD
MLYRALLLLKTEEECADFLRDLLTDEEIEDFVSRWKIARMLDEKVSYEEIQNITKRSSTTVARVSKWLKKSKSGYRIILDRLKEER